MGSFIFQFRHSAFRFKQIQVLPRLADRISKQDCLPATRFVPPHCDAVTLAESGQKDSEYRPSRQLPLAAKAPASTRNRNHHWNQRAVGSR
jgi:hypothetical protein